MSHTGNKARNKYLKKIKSQWRNQIFRKILKAIKENAKEFLINVSIKPVWIV